MKLLKKLLSCLFLAVGIQANSQTGVPLALTNPPAQLSFDYQPLAAGTYTLGPFKVTGLQYYIVQWNVSGTVTGCTATLDGSASDTGSFTTGSLMVSQTCNSTGSYVSATAVTSVRAKLSTTFSNTGTVRFTIQGFVIAPALNGGALPNGTTATTQALGDNSTKVATTAYVGQVVTPGTLGQPSLYTSANSVGSSAIYFDVSIMQVVGVGDACARMRAAEVASTAGVTLDARAFSGAQECALNPFPSTAVSNLLLGNTILNVHQTWCTPGKIHVYGIGWDKNPITGIGATTLRASSDLAVGGANAGPIVAWGNNSSCLAGQVIQDTSYHDLTFDCNLVSTTAIQAFNPQEGSGADTFNIVNCGGGGANLGSTSMVVGGPAQLAAQTLVTLTHNSTTITCTACFDPSDVNAQFTVATADTNCIAGTACFIQSIQSTSSATLSTAYTGTTLASPQALTWASASSQNSYFIHGNIGLTNKAGSCPTSGNAPGPLLVMNTGSGANMGTRVFDDMTFVVNCTAGGAIPPVWVVQISGAGFNGRAWHLESGNLTGATGGVVIGLDATSTAISLDGVTCTNMTNATDCVRISNAFAGTAFISLRNIKNITPSSTNVLTDQQASNSITEGTLATYITGSTSGRELITSAHLIPSRFPGLIVTAGANGLNTVQFFKNDGTTNVLDVDTTNTRVGIGSSAGTPGATLDVGGAFWVSSGGVITKAAGLTVSTPGAPLILANTVSATTNAGANLGSTQLIPGVANSHTMRFSWYVSQIAAGTGSCSATASTIVLNLIFTDPNAAGSNTLPMIGFGPNTNTSGISTTITIATSGSPLGAAGQVVASGSYTFNSKNNTAVNYTTTGAVAPTGCTLVPTYAVQPILELIR
jgi:hypothetical protein